MITMFVVFAAGVVFVLGAAVAVSVEDELYRDEREFGEWIRALRAEPPVEFGEPMVRLRLNAEQFRSTIDRLQRMMPQPPPSDEGAGR